MKLQSDFLNFEIYPNVIPTDKLNFIYENNSKNTLIIIKNANTTNLEFLSKILTAIKFDIENDIILLEVPDNHQINFAELKKGITTNIETVVLFGINPKQLDLQFKLPNYYKLSVNQINYLGAEDLSTIANNNSKKKELWAALQILF